MENPEVSLGVALGRKGVGTQLDSFLEACQQWQDSFKERGVQIIQGNLNLLHNIQSNYNKLVSIVNQDFGLMNEVHTQTEDLQALRLVNGQRYRMLMEVYAAKKLDNHDDWIEKDIDRK